MPDTKAIEEISNSQNSASARRSGALEGRAACDSEGLLQLKENAHGCGQEHELRRLFHEVVGQCYGEGIGIRDSEMTTYVADLLTEFCEAEHLYKIRDEHGRALDDVGEMLLESDPVFGPAHSFDRERAVRKHVGDYTLFFAGMFPDSLHQRIKRQRVSSMLELVFAGKQSYFVVSKFDCGEYASEAGLFARLAEGFESCVYGLNLVRAELDKRKYLVGGARAAGLLM